MLTPIFGNLDAVCDNLPFRIGECPNGNSCGIDCLAEPFGVYPTGPHCPATESTSSIRIFVASFRPVMPAPSIEGIVVMLTTNTTALVRVNASGAGTIYCQANRGMHMAKSATEVVRSVYSGAIVDNKATLLIANLIPSTFYTVQCASVSPELAVLNDTAFLAQEDAPFSTKCCKEVLVTTLLSSVQTGQPRPGSVAPVTSGGPPDTDEHPSQINEQKTKGQHKAGGGGVVRYVGQRQNRREEGQA